MQTILNENVFIKEKNMQSNLMKNKYSTTIELPVATIVFRKEGFTHIHYKNQSVNITESQKIFEVIRKNSPWYKCPFLISGDDFSNLDKESKSYNSSDEVTKHMSAQAFIVKNSIQTITVNFFVKVFKPKVPLKMFSTISEAEPWLQSFIAENIALKNNI